MFSTIGGVACAFGGLNARAANIATRVDFKKLSQQDQSLFAAAVELMMKREASDPGSWYYLAATHSHLDFKSRAELLEAAKKDPGLLDIGKYIDFDKLGKVPAGAQTTWNSCIHRGSKTGKGFFKAGHFQSWHRLYLETFETHFMTAVAAVAKDKGVKAGFNALPYWDYFSDPTLPEIFRLEKLHGVDNPLFISTREPALLDGSGGVSASREAMTATDMLHQPFSLPGHKVFGFDGLVEGRPHDVIHGQISGLMGMVPTAAWDPIFYLHHCNIDRIWAAWASRQPQSNAAPDADSNWKNESFVFITAKGQVLWNAERALQTNGYQYDSLEIKGAPPVPLQQPIKKPPQLNAGPSIQGMKPESLSKPLLVEVTSAGGVLSLPLVSAAKNKINAMGLDKTQSPATGTPTSLYVVLDDITFTAEGGRRAVVFDVQVAIPLKPGAAPIAPVSVGTINKFTHSVSGQPTTLRFDVTEVARSVAKSGAFSPSSIQILLVPQQLVKPDGTPLVPKPSGPLVRVGSVHVEAAIDK